jgi:hypothetical protein
MSAPATGWMNKVGTGRRDPCRCRTWAQHWANYGGGSWPSLCSVALCNRSPTLGAHIVNPDVGGEMIVPMCDACNAAMGVMTLRSGTIIVSANKALTCEAHP